MKLSLKVKSTIFLAGIIFGLFQGLSKKNVTADENSKESVHYNNSQDTVFAQNPSITQSLDGLWIGTFT